MTGWLIPVTDPARPTVRVCSRCERRDPFLSALSDADAGVHVAPSNRWTRETIETCEHPDHKADAAAR